MRPRRAEILLLLGSLVFVLLVAEGAFRLLGLAEPRTMPPPPTYKLPPVRLRMELPARSGWPNWKRSALATVLAPRTSMATWPAVVPPRRTPAVASLEVKVPPAMSRTDQRSGLLMVTVVAPSTVRLPLSIRVLAEELVAFLPMPRVPVMLTAPPLM